MSVPRYCPCCGESAAFLVWDGGSPYRGPDRWSCLACNHQWETPPEADDPDGQHHD